MKGPGTNLEIHQHVCQRGMCFLGLYFACCSGGEEAGATCLHVPPHTGVTPAKNDPMPVGVHESFLIDFNTSRTKILPKTLTEKEIRT